jgi:hypothetical protein
MLFEGHRSRTRNRICNRSGEAIIVGTDKLDAELSAPRWALRFHDRFERIGSLVRKTAGVAGDFD